MRSISIKEPHASAIASGRKRSEHRSRRLAVGPLLIASGGHAVCVVDLVRVTGDAGSFEWHFARARRVVPFPLRSYGWVTHVADHMVKLVRSGAPAPRSTPARRSVTVVTSRVSRKVPVDGGSDWAFVDARGREITSTWGLGYVGDDD